MIFAQFQTGGTCALPIAAWSVRGSVDKAFKRQWRSTPAASSSPSKTTAAQVWDLNWYFYVSLATILPPSSLFLWSFWFWSHEPICSASFSSFQPRRRTSRRTRKYSRKDPLWQPMRGDVAVNAWLVRSRAGVQLVMKGRAWKIGYEFLADMK